MERARILCLFAVAALVFGLAAVPVLAAASADQEVAKKASDPVYDSWKKWYERIGGDQASSIALGPIRGISPSTGSRGKVSLNLVDGVATVSLRNLDKAVDIWLVDNKEGPGKSFLPEEGDNMIRLGRLEAGATKLSKELGNGFFNSFELDLVVVSEADVSPVKSRLLVGSRSTFERRYTRDRLRLNIPELVSVHGDFSINNDPRVRLGLVSADVLIGANLFFRGTFQGNDRSCGTCHPPRNNLVTDPRDIQNRLRRSPADPLFVALPGFRGRFPVPRLERPDLLVDFGLILENVDGFEDPGVKFIMRSVPHTLSLATSLGLPGPADPPATDPNGNTVLADGSTDEFIERTGWSGDGVFPPGTLRLFPVGAVIQHYTRDFDVREPSPASFRLQTDTELDRMEQFMLNGGRLNELDLATVSLTNASADRGRVIFNTGVGGGKCFGCHGNAGANSPFGGNRNFDTGIETVRIARLDAQNIPSDGGFGGQEMNSFNFDADGDGVNDSFGNGGFNTPPLIEAADTGPFFHSNAFETIEDAVEFYSSPAFNNSPAAVNILNAVFGEGINLNQQQNDDVANMLRVLNASFNIQMAIQRIEAARRIGGAFGLSARNLTNSLLILASDELFDARRVLKEKGLNRSQRFDVEDAIIFLDRAIRSRNANTRAFNSGAALSRCNRANGGLGTGLGMTMGQANLTF